MIQIDIQLERLTFASTSTHRNQYTFPFVYPEHKNFVTVRHSYLNFSFHGLFSLDASDTGRSTFLAKWRFYPENLVTIIEKRQVLSGGAQSSGVYPRTYLLIFVTQDSAGGSSAEKREVGWITFLCKCGKKGRVV